MLQSSFPSPLSFYCFLMLQVGSLLGPDNSVGLCSPMVRLDTGLKNLLNVTGKKMFFAFLFFATSQGQEGSLSD